MIGLLTRYWLTNGLPPEPPDRRWHGPPGDGGLAAPPPPGAILTHIAHARPAAGLAPVRAVVLRHQPGDGIARHCHVGIVESARVAHLFGGAHQRPKGRARE